ncbi:hypothetical protein CHARACLAT_009340 [Characodon lateralis]|uniref:Uncharacterized protein n=1 Tax=Characodon lateralis TaxID=208331 RepID=A0ABU7DQA4_9TELE|nr:hypothetical protein [Characodon lateralis]
MHYRKNMQKKNRLNPGSSCCKVLQKSNLSQRGPEEMMSLIEAVLEKNASEPQLCRPSCRPIPRTNPERPNGYLIKY